MSGLLRQGHFLGTKLKTLRKRNGLTLDELSDVVDPDRVEITRSAMYRHIRERLALDENALYLRMREIRKLLTGGIAA